MNDREITVIAVGTLLLIYSWVLPHVAIRFMWPCRGVLHASWWAAWLTGTFCWLALVMDFVARMVLDAQ